MTKGGIVNTHYNLIDTLRTFIPSNTWNNIVMAVLAEHKKSIYMFIDSNMELVNSSISIIANLTSIQKAIPYDLPVRYTICEAIIWSLYNGDYGLT